MTKLPKALEEMRDNLAAEHAEDTWLRDYQNGFDACYHELKTRADKLANALEKILGTREYSTQKEPHKLIADEALAEWEEFLGEKK